MIEINWIEVGIHVLNVIVLFVILRLLLFKPVMKFIKKREHTFADKVDELDLRDKDLIQKKKEYEFMMDEASNEAASIITNSNEMARDHAREVLDNSKEHARDLVIRAKKEIEAEKVQARLDMKTEIADMAIQIAEKVLEREVSLDDNRKIIDEFFERVG
ncbi:MAG: F0F1 ATP synthase subunit B [Clostridia bacterium]|jgi:F-type H+-transporting ATPase subunit b|nr:F0F1 ATP synthase subunit B [Clostridia bacterium]